MTRASLLAIGVAAIGLGAVAPAFAQELNLYSSRHYQTDEALYENFTRDTGITINRIEGKADALIERIKAEGANSPADVLLTVDAGRLWRAEQADLFMPVESEMLEDRVPANLRDPDNRWFGFSTRARIIYFDKDRFTEETAPQSYEELADPKFKDEICIRSSSNIYNLSLMASMIDHHGAEAAQEWAEGVVANFARKPQGGDTDQIRAVAAGECGIAVGNHYYYTRLARSDDPADQAVVEAVGHVWPNQDGRGTHVNISGAGVLKTAPNKDEAVKFLEYLASDEAQQYLANGNNEYPVVMWTLENEALEGLGNFKVDPINIAVYGENQPQAQRVYDRAGWP